MSTTLGTLKSRITNLADDSGKALFSDSQLTEEINASGQVFHALIVDTAPDLLMKSATITPDGSSSYSLPSDFLKEMGVWRIIQSTSNGADLVPLWRVEWPEVHRFSSSQSAQAAQVYVVQNNTLQLYPPPATGSDNYLVNYVPSWPTLANDIDTLYNTGSGAGYAAALDHWYDWIVYDVVAKMRMKEESDSAPWELRKKQVEQEIRAWAAVHSLFRPQRIIDARFDRSGPLPGVVFRDPDFWAGR